MCINIEVLREDQEAAYDEMLQSMERSLIYASLKYRDFLTRILVGSAARYLIAYESGRMVGALPLFIKRNHTYGNVINSLPFYGGNGGILLSPAAQETELVTRSLVEGLDAIAAQESVVASTLVSNPLDSREDLYQSYAKYTLRDERVGQVTFLPIQWDSPHELQDTLLKMFHPKTRNSIRKAMKSELTIRHSESLDAMQTLAKLHRQNLEAIGGLAKPWTVFEQIRRTFTYDRDYRVYTAERSNTIIAALLVFFYNRTAEYYTPASAEDSRVYQGMSLLVFEAMQEAARRGCRYWNWGGTWTSQEGVYRFKSRWGTTDCPYYYYVREYDKGLRLRHVEPRTLLTEYPYFYVIPFRHAGASV